MSGSSQEFLASLATQPWRPRSLQPRRRPEPIRRAWRVTILLAVLAVHLIGARWLLLMFANGETANETTVVIQFIEPPPLPPLDALPTPGPTPPSAKPGRRPKPAIRLPRASGPALQAMPARPLRLYDEQGRLLVPDDLLEQIDKRIGDQRVFSYQIPHLDDAHKFFDRKPAVEYRATRFAGVYRPTQDVLTGLLTTLVEKSTKEIRVPVPGHPRSTMVCRVALLAFSGSCDILTNGADYVGPVDDPDTLSPEEDRECAGWWNQIVGTSSQEIWRKTRSLYEQQCRKPLARQRPGA